MGETYHDMMHDMWMHVFKDLSGLVVIYSFGFGELCIGGCPSTRIMLTMSSGL